MEEIEEEDEEAFLQDEEAGLRRGLTQAEAALSSSVHFGPDSAKPHDETTPLMQSTISKGARHGPRMRRKRAASVSGHGEASVTDAVLMVRPELLLCPCRCSECFDSYSRPSLEPVFCFWVKREFIELCPSVMLSS